MIVLLFKIIKFQSCVLYSVIISNIFILYSQLAYFGQISDKIAS